MYYELGLKLKKSEREREREREKAVTRTDLGGWRANLVRRGASTVVWILRIALPIANIAPLLSLLLCSAQLSLLHCFYVWGEVKPASFGGNSSIALDNYLSLVSVLYNILFLGESFRLFIYFYMKREFWKSNR